MYKGKWDKSQILKKRQKKKCMGPFQSTEVLGVPETQSIVTAVESQNTRENKRGIKFNQGMSWNPFGNVLEANHSERTWKRL